MANIINMTNTGINQNSSFDLTSGETSDTLVIRHTENTLSMAIHPNPTGAGKFQFTLSSIEKIKADTALWVDWSKGNVNVTTTDILMGPVTGIRVVCSSGDVIAEVVG
jgi:hypothetical protein